jgi:hypothetical protein
MPLEECRERHNALFQGLLVNDVESRGEHFLINLMRPFRNRLAGDIFGNQPFEACVVSGQHAEVNDS